MIIFSNAIPKSASTLVANQQCRLLEQSNLKSGQEKLSRQMGGRYLESATINVLARLTYISVCHGTCVVKCHWGESSSVAALLRSGLARMTMCFRDPRDIVLSALDHGQRSRDGKDPAMAFAELLTFEDGVEFARAVMAQFNFWFDQPGVHPIRYEDLMTDQCHELRKMCDFLELRVPPAVIENAVQEELQRKATAWNFNKGTVFRYREEMSPDQIAICNEAFSDSISKLGYQI